MRQFGEILESQRKARRISLKKASKDLRIAKEHLQALEAQDWQNLPEAPFVKGFIISYCRYLGLDPEKTLPLYRREYDERQFQKDPSFKDQKKRLYLTPARLINFIFFAALATFVAYLLIQYSSILSAPKLEINSPSDDENVTVPVIIIQGQTEEDTTVSVDGEFVPVDTNGDFSYQYSLEEGKNTIEIIASKRLSPKTKVERTVRLVN